MNIELNHSIPHTMSSICNIVLPLWYDTLGEYKKMPYCRGVVFSLIRQCRTFELHGKLSEF